MNVSQLSMPADQAKQKLLEVRDALRFRADREYQQLERAYAQAAKGRALINLRDAMTSAPLDEFGLPRIAIARADRTRVEVERMSNGDLVFNSEKQYRERAESLTRRFNGVLPRRDHWTTGYALVPMIPPAARKQAGYRRRLDTMFILWEVERWERVRNRTTPDHDPFLLKHIGGDLYAVLAQWDLTPIEQAVMAARSQS